MNYIGIDYSMNSVGITIKNSNGIQLNSVLNRWSLSSAKEFDLKIFKGVVKPVISSLDSCVLYERQPNKKIKSKNKLIRFQELNTAHRKQISDADSLAHIVSEHIMNFIDKNTIIGIENYLINKKSFGDSTIQLIEFTMALKVYLLEHISLDRVYIIPASQIKEMSGFGGNATKLDMLNGFLKSNLNHKFKSTCFKLKKELVNSNGDIKKPVDDVVDSFFIVKFLESMKLH